MKYIIIGGKKALLKLKYPINHSFELKDLQKEADLVGLEVNQYEEALRFAIRNYELGLYIKCK